MIPFHENYEKATPFLQFDRETEWNNCQIALKTFVWIFRFKTAVVGCPWRFRYFSFIKIFSAKTTLKKLGGIAGWASNDTAQGVLKFHCTFWSAQLGFRGHVLEAKLFQMIISNSEKLIKIASQKFVNFWKMTKNRYLTVFTKWEELALCV